MKPIAVIGGIVILLMGSVFALQGAYVLEATFMRGPAWIAIGAAIALAGLVIVLLGLRPTGPSRAA